ncbi:MAG: metallophosphoesterase [Planctomycetota bacterium]
MPIELTRRDVIRAGLAGTVAGGLSGCVYPSHHPAPGPLHQPELDRVLILSDTHIAADTATLSRARVNMAERLRAVLAAMHRRDQRWTKHVGRDRLAPVPNPFGLRKMTTWSGQVDYRFGLVCGDTTYDIGTAGDYATLVDVLDPMRWMDIHLLLGNHDDRVNFRAVLDDPPSALTDKHVRKLGVDDGSRYCDWLLLDSLRRVDEVPGALEARQLAWLESTLHEASGATSLGPSRGEGRNRPAVIVVHHPPVPDDDPQRPFSLQDHEAFWAIVAKHPNVKAVLHGHTHRWHPRRCSLGNREVDLIGLPPTSYVFDEANPWGYVVADIDVGGATFTLRAMDGHAADGDWVRVAF